ncbi:MAG: hypothetical protein K2V71_00730 [Methylotenera sp.]|nr:hypothetical protein [Methylotenera sp.]
MKVVVQRGDLISREEIEALFITLPQHIGRNIETFIVYASNNTTPSYYFNKKAKTFGFYSPQNSQLTKTEAQSGIAIHLLAAIELGHLPEKLSSTKLQDLKKTWAELCAKKHLTPHSSVTNKTYP